MGTRAAVEFETEIRVSLAERHYLAGDHDQALAAAKEALALSQQRSNRLTECRALIVCGGVLGQKADAGSWSEASSLFNQAEQLITLTGARIYESGLTSERDRLAQWMAR